VDSKQRIVITGLGAVSAFGVGSDTLFSGLSSGKSAIGPITQYDSTAHAVHIAGEVAGYAPGDHFERKELRRLGRFAQFALVAAREAIANAGLEFGSEDPHRVATVVGSGIGDFEMIEDQLRGLFKRGPGRMSPFTVPRVITSMASANVAMEFGLTGPSFGTSSACATGGHAIAMAALLLRAGAVDVALAGGAESCLAPGSVESYHALRALSTREVEPERASCPFDRDRDGFVIAEGAGILVLETAAHAEARGAAVLAEFAGAGMTCDAHHITACHEDGREAVAAMRAALAEGETNPDEIDHVNAHGTSTPLNDPAETRALKTVFGDRAMSVPVSSNKSMIGHALGASGALEAVASVRTITDGVIPPTINLHHPDPECDLDYVPHVAREAEVRRVLSCSYGFGGQNCALLFRA